MPKIGIQSHYLELRHASSLIGLLRMASARFTAFKRREGSHVGQTQPQPVNEVHFNASQRGLER
jgi:hypothetical protein